jgi:exonuclease III
MYSTYFVTFFLQRAATIIFKDENVILELMIQDALFLIVYAPTKTNEQCDILQSLETRIEEKLTHEHKIIIGGDFNVILDKDLDASGGTPI